MVSLEDHIPALNEALVRLDLALTGKCAHNAMARTVNLDQALFEIIYLSDGGYSRVFFSDVTGLLNLTSNSRQEVKNQWDIVRSEREVVENLLRGFWLELDPEKIWESG